MSTRVDVEEIQTTNGEKLLSLVLALFLLIGGIWVYVKIGDAVRTTSPPDISYRGTPAEQAAVDELRSAQGQLSRAQVAAANARDNLELKREAYRTALEAHRAEATRLGVAYDSARKRYAQARQNVVEAKTDVARAQPAATSAERHIAQVQSGRVHKRELLAFALRLAWVLANLLFGYWLLARLRRRGSRYYPVGIAFVGYAAVLAFVMATDYLTDYFDPLDLGPFVLSIAGIVLDAARLRRAAAIPRQTASRTPRSEARVPVLRFPGSRQHPLRGLRPRRSRPVRALRPAPPRRRVPLRGLRRGLGARELRVALLEEGGDALLEVVRLSRGGLKLGFGLELLLERVLEGL